MWNGFFLSAGGGSGLVHGVGAPRARGFLQLAYLGMTEEHRRKQADLEMSKFPLKAAPAVEWSVLELKPNCPADPSQFDPEKNDPGCPKYYELSQIAQLRLVCPSKPEEFDPAVHDQGCPKVYEMQKGLSASEYATVYVLAASGLAGKCPEDPAQFDPTRHDPSCPKFFELKETVALVANCPEKAADFNPEIHDPLCSKVYTLRQQFASKDVQAIRFLSKADADGDGILDFEDRCPHLPGIPAAFGCPEEEAAFKKGERLGTSVPIAFAFNRAEVNAPIAKALNEVAAVLLNHPEIQRVRIEGSADSVGTEEANLKVSRQRALNVKRFLEKCGIARERLKAIGVGARKPLAPNRTAEGRAKNRTATVIILELVN